MPLVEYDEQCDFLGLASGTDKQLIEDLLLQVTALFENECGRDQAPFSATLTARTEILEADPGSAKLWLDYPIAAITSIALGRDVAIPEETLNPADPTKVVWRVGSREIIRTDGALWRRGTWSTTWVKVVYDTQADLPDDAKLAIKRMVATVYQHRGKEGFSAVTRGSRSWTIAAGAAADDPLWKSAVSHHLRTWVR